MPLRQADHAAKFPHVRNCLQRRVIFAGDAFDYQAPAFRLPTEPTGGHALAWKGPLSGGLEPQRCFVCPVRRIGHMSRIADLSAARLTLTFYTKVAAARSADDPLLVNRPGVPTPIGELSY
jgi:hypothetical protein